MSESLRNTDLEKIIAHEKLAKVIVPWLETEGRVSLRKLINWYGWIRAVSVPVGEEFKYDKNGEIWTASYTFSARYCTGGYGLHVHMSLRERSKITGKYHFDHEVIQSKGIETSFSSNVDPRIILNFAEQIESGKVEETIRRAITKGGEKDE